MKEPDLLEMLYVNQNDLNIRLQLLHQIAEFLPAAEINVNNWRYLGQLFKGRQKQNNKSRKIYNNSAPK